MSEATDATGPQALQTASLASVAAEVVDRVRAIYEEAFPAHQREPFEDIAALARDGDAIAVAGMRDGDPVGLAFLTRLDGVGHYFLEYFAVAADRRGGGIGQALWRAVATTLDPRPVVLEVEDPAEPGIDVAEAAQRERRVRFWEKVGARMLPVADYLVPRLGEDGVEPLLLMWIAGAPGAVAPAGGELGRLVVALYVDGYGLDPGHPLVVRAGEAA